MSSTTEIKADRHYGVDEPWRYRCPECRATRSRIRKRSRDTRTIQYEGDPKAPYYCDKCSSALFAFYDMKEQREVQVGSRDEPEGNAGDGLSDVNPYEWKL